MTSEEPGATCLGSLCTYSRCPLTERNASGESHGLRKDNSAEGRRLQAVPLRYYKQVLVAAFSRAHGNGLLSQ
jgi:hypothetical protein